MDVLFINPDSSTKAYQDLAKTYSAIEPLHGHFYWRSHAEARDLM